MKLLAIVLIIISLTKLTLVNELKYLTTEVFNTQLLEFDNSVEYLKYFLIFDGLLGILCGLYIIIM